MDLYQELMQKLLVYGVEEVADMRHARDVAETLWRANLEAIQAIKVEIRVLENVIAREYGTPSVSGYGGV